ncbi:MAG: amidohydrolase family protein [Patescibacteria group bacterium]|nr:amidohydrolase family protein [Patescibacteria group bacterium]
MACHRRQFLKTAGRFALASGVLAEAARALADASGPIAIVDTHQHLWDLSRIQLPWLAGRDLLNRSYLPEDYLKAIEGLNVVKAVYMEVAAPVEQHLIEAEYVLDLCRRDDFLTCAAVLGGRPGEPGFRDYILRFKDSPFVKGIRQGMGGPASQPPFFLEEPFVNGVRLLGELGMSFDLVPPPHWLQAAAELVSRCPNTRFVLDHCGNADVKVFMAAASEKDSAAQEKVDQWRRGIEAVAKHDRAICKISGIIARVPAEGWSSADLAPIVNHCLECFGPDRVVFASDWPVCLQGASLRRWVEVLGEIVASRPAAEQRKLFAENAIQFYGLTG